MFFEYKIYNLYVGYVLMTIVNNFSFLKIQNFAPNCRFFSPNYVEALWDRHSSKVVDESKNMYGRGHKNILIFWNYPPKFVTKC